MTLQYVFGMSPLHANAPKYFACVWPLAAFVPVFCARLFGRLRGAVLVTSCLWYVASGSFAPANLRISGHGAQVTEPHILIDMTQRLHLPRILPRMPATAQLFVADQPDMTKLQPWRGLGGAFAYLGCRANAERTRGVKQLASAMLRKHRLSSYRHMGKCWNIFHYWTP
jgi:hypothetical protein